MKYNNKKRKKNSKIKKEKRYKYPHNYPGNFVKQQYMPDKLKGKKYYKEK